jgi:hypothetical protein
MNAMVGSAVVLLLFAVSDDARFRHLVRIESPEVQQRLGMSAQLEAHIVPRTDVSGAALWMRAQARASPGALWINAYPSADYYFRHFAFTYIDRNAQRFRAFACRRGTYDRWGNLPLVSSPAELKRRVTAAPAAFMVASPRESSVEPDSGLQSRIVWQAGDGQLEIRKLSSNEPGRLKKETGP